MKTNTWRGELLDLEFQNVDAAGLGDAGGLQNSAAAGNYYCSLHTAFPGLAGNQGSSELARAGYARKAIPRDAANWTRTGNEVVNDLELLFTQITDVGSTDVFYAGLGDDSAGAGKLRRICFVGDIASIVPATATAADTFTAPGHTLANNDRVILMGAPAAGGVPAGATEGTVYFVINVSGDTFQISTTQGGGAVNITAAGGCLVAEVTPMTIVQNSIPRLAAGQLKIREF